jgi:hypothetical protein
VALTQISRDVVYYVTRTDKPAGHFPGVRLVLFYTHFFYAGWFTVPITTLSPTLHSQDYSQKLIGRWISQPFQMQRIILAPNVPE